MGFQINKNTSIDPIITQGKVFSPVDFKQISKAASELPELVLLPPLAKIIMSNPEVQGLKKLATNKAGRMAQDAKANILRNLGLTK